MNFTQKPASGGTPAIVAKAALNQKIIAGTCVNICISDKYLILQRLKLNKPVNIVNVDMM